MPLLHPALSHLEALVFDLDGVLYQEGAAIGGAARAVRELAEAGVPLRFLTNTTSKSRRQVSRKLKRLGFAVEAAAVHSPPAAAGQFLRQHQASAFLLVQEAALADFEGILRDDTRPDYVVVGDLGVGWTFEMLNRAFQCVQEGGAGLIGLGRTRYWQTEGRLQLDAGPFVTALEYATGREARIFGKPAPTFFKAVLDDLGLEADAVALVGDDVETDVRAAMRVGCFGVLVRTGKFRAGDLDGVPPPDLVLDSVAEVLQ